MRKEIRRIAIMLSVIVFGFFLTMTLFLFFYQRRMIYFPRRYDPSYQQGLPSGTIEIEYRTSSGRQVCFYVPPRENPSQIPESLWIFFGGNASLALDWLVYENTLFPPSSGILLPDYPGYGLCEGKPTYRTIGESSDAAFLALAARLRTEPENLQQNLNILGHSLGAAAALQFAEKRPVKNVILLAPFSSLLDMARKTAGWPLCHVLLDRFDNARVLDHLACRNPPPNIHIFHGDADRVVPFSMGKKLAERNSTKVIFHPFKGVDHNSIIEVGVREIRGIMTPAVIEE